MVFCSKLNNSPMVEFIPIATQELVVIVPKDHPLAVKDSVSLTAVSYTYLDVYKRQI